MDFRPLRADEIEVRVQQVNEKGAILLLYKDARADMKLLDESVGAENWDCTYVEIGGRLYCMVGIHCQLNDGSMQWVVKQDVGTDSNMEAEKGAASDAFKRACFKWGIGRELYTAPFIWVPRESLQKHFEKNGKWVCYDKFRVKHIEIKEGHITELEIVNQFVLSVYKFSLSVLNKRGKNG